MEDLGDNVFNTVAPRTQASPRTCIHHPSVLTRTAAGLHLCTVHVGKILMWNGPYQFEVVKEARGNGDARVMWAMGSTLRPTRPGKCWQLIIEPPPPPCTHEKEGKPSGQTIRCPCEWEVCIAWHEY